MKKLLLILLCLPLAIIAQTSHTVNAGMFYYSPSVLNINLGINTLTGLSFNNPESFVSIPTSSIEIYSHVFTISGTYYYDCSVYGHASAGMTGIIIVNSVNSINEQNNTQKTVEVFEILGFSSNKIYNNIKIYRYSDGTVEKRIVLE